MNVAAMTSGALCLCTQVPAAQASSRASFGGNGLPIAAYDFGLGEGLVVIYKTMGR